MVRVTACRFLRISCSEDDHPLFRRYYARSNRERGVKLLRCFPHCCPEHVQRCYCGSSIHVLVTFAEELPAADRGNVVVCARFEPSRVVPLWPANLVDVQRFQEGDNENNNERKLHPGEVVSIPATLLPSGNRKAKQVGWIRGDREGESKQTTKNAVLYVLNNHRFPKWAYSYDSSVTRTQREMTHHLVVYVFQLTGSRSQPGHVNAAVLARYESPGFSLISYRRSGINARDAGCDLPGLEVANDGNFAALPGDLPHENSAQSNGMEIDSPEWQEPFPYENKRPSARDTQNVPPAGFFQQKQHHEETKDAKSRGLRLDSYEWTDRFDDLAQDNSSWQRGRTARACGFREKGQHLLILWRFLHNVSLRDLGFGPDVVDEHVRPHWLRAASVLRATASTDCENIKDVTSSFLSGLFSSTFVVQQNHKSAATATAFSDRERFVLRVTAHLFLRLVSLRSVQERVRSACSAMDETHVQEGFVLLVSHVYDTFSDVLREIPREMRPAPFGNQVASVGQLVDEVLSIVYTQPHFAEEKAELSALLLDHQILSDALSDYALVLSAVRRKAELAPSHWRQQLFELRHKESSRLWNQRWLLEPGSLQLVDVSSGENKNVEDLNLLDVAQFVYEFGCFDVTIEEHAACMSIRSVLSILNGSLAAPMTLVLDGKFRALNVLPTGILSTIGGWTTSKYSAVLSDDCRSVSIHLLGFSEAQMNNGDRIRGLRRSGHIPLRRISFSMKLEEEINNDEDPRPSDAFAFVHGIVYGSVFYSADEQIERLTLSDSSLDRSEIWKQAKWTPLSEFQAGFIALHHL
ncbi:hypothetical protein P3T76_011878 [Phytophthora citrophthora]|uniref:Uncharacterized protein n=1 Tax=Phytophthora citrophthora TaxID=4793 RepID=A0AAD9G824_9STRA|nr:hypothetical protein P3T76_011878 [Phytophthora citrophthora]